MFKRPHCRLPNYQGKVSRKVPASLDVSTLTWSEVRRSKMVGVPILGRSLFSVMIAHS